MAEYQLQPSPLMRSGRRVYQFGTEDVWTPGIEFVGGVAGDPVVFSSRTGTYIRIGRLVICHFAVIISSPGTATGTAQMSGLPFVSDSWSSGMSGLVIWSNAATTLVNMAFEVNANVASGYFYSLTGANISFGAATNAIFNSNMSLAGMFQYFSTQS